MNQHLSLMDEQHSPLHENDSFEQTVIILSLQSVTFIFYSICFSFVMWKLKGEIMTRLKIVLILFALAFFVRMILDILRIIYFE